MKHSLEINQSLTKIFVVKEEHTADHIGSGSVSVLATPILIAFMESTALELMSTHLPKGYTSVGTKVEIRHLAPSALGSTLKVTAQIAKIDKNNVILTVNAWDEDTLIGRGTHDRHIIELERFKKQIISKNLKNLSNN